MPLARTASKRSGASEPAVVVAQLAVDPDLDAGRLGDEEGAGRGADQVDLQVSVALGAMLTVRVSVR